MRTLTSIILATLLAAPLTGCIVHEHRRGPGYSARRGNDCPPAHHWNGYRCEHNGRANGHRK